MAARIMIAAVVLAGLAACSPNDRQPPTRHLDDKAAPRQQIVTVRDDLTTGKVVFHGIPFLAPDSPGIVRRAFRLRSELDKTGGAAAHWVDLRVRWVGSGMDHWARAQEEHDGAAPVPLKLGPAQLEVGTCAAWLWFGCDHDEEITAQLPEEMLLKAATEGVTVRFAMTGGRSYIARITPEQAAAQLARLAAWRQDRR